MEAMTSRLRWTSGVLAALLVLGLAADARAQLDQLLFLKRTVPNVLLVVDTANRMQRDANNDYYDPFVYPVGGIVANPWEETLKITSLTATTSYRRKYVNLTHLNPDASAGDRFRADTIAAVGDKQAGYSTFDARTRLAIARAALVRAINQNATAVRFGLIKTRQSNPRILAGGSNEGPVIDADDLQQTPTDLTNKKWKITRPVVDASNGSLTTVAAPLVKPDASGANDSIVAILNKAPATGGALLPAGTDASGTLDAPVDNLLDDAKAEAARLIAADVQCRNTVVVLIVGGGEGNTTSEDPAAKASQFLSIAGRRVPIYVVALAPPADDVVQLRAIASNSGGQYFEITANMINAVSADAVVPDVVRAVNTAVQNAFALPSDVDATVANPKGRPSQFQVTSPVVGSVNLENAKDITGTTLPLTRIYRPDGKTVIPQRSNLLVTTELELPGFAGRLRGFRVYQPVGDSSKASGYRFDKDGTKLWVSSTPAAGSRNIFTALPDGTMVAFTTANQAVLSPYLATSDAAGLISYVRAQPLGAFVGSTPAIMDPPSLDPPPDPDYPAFAVANKGRRTLIFAGANDGMMHAFDARSGVEVWAFIPFNLLPKLKALPEGQSLDAFRYFVDSSAKVSDVKVDGAWRTYLIFGEGPGGTFYQTLDVTLAGMGAVVSDTDDTVSNLLSYFADAARIPLKWSFPRYSSFDVSIAPYGDVSATATDVEKTVGETWSDPAVGQVETASGPYVVLAGSGFLKYSVQRANRGNHVAGTTFYVLDAKTGNVLDSRDVGNDGIAETVDDCRAVDDCSQLKNALQADPVATGPSDQRFITKSYLGDLDGHVWRFDLGLDDSGKAAVKDLVKLHTVTANGTAASNPLFASMATVNVGGTQQYLFFGTGSEFLPQNGVDKRYSLLVVLDNGTSGAQTAEIPLATSKAGTGEWVTAFPAVAGDIVFFSTNAISSADACTGFTGALYAFTFIGGPAYDTNSDGRLTTKSGGDTAKVSTAVGTRVSAPFIVDQHVSIGGGATIQMFGDPKDFNNGVGQAGIRVLSWREVR